MRRALLGLFALALAIGGAHAKIPGGGSGVTYYVNAAAGNDNNAGTSLAAPWQTQAKVRNAGGYNPGDTICFIGAQTYSDAIGLNLNGDGQGTALNPITVTSCPGTGTATLRVTGLSGECFNVSQTNGYVITNLTCVGPGAGATGMGIDAGGAAGTGLNFLYVKNLDISGFDNCISFTNPNNLTPSYQNVSIQGVACHDNLEDGIDFLNATNSQGLNYQNIFIDKVQVYNHPGILGNLTGNGIQCFGCRQAVIQRSVVHDVGAASGTTVGIMSLCGNGVLILGNEVYNVKTTNSTDADGIDIDNCNINVRASGNWVHDNNGPGFLAQQSAATNTQPWGLNVISENVTQNNNNGTSGQPGELSIGGIAGTYGYLGVFANTFYAGVGTQPVVDFVTTVTGLVCNVSNNIFVAKTATNRIIETGAVNPANCIFQNNDYTGSTNNRWNNVAYTTMATWLAAVTTQESYRGANTSLTSAPSLTNAGGGATIWPAALSTLTAYQIQGGSPMAGTGQNLAALYGFYPLRDFYGRVTPAPSNGTYDVGALQLTQ